MILPASYKCVEIYLLAHSSFPVYFQAASYLVITSCCHWEGSICRHEQLLCLLCVETITATHTFSFAQS